MIRCSRKHWVTDAPKSSTQTPATNTQNEKELVDKLLIMRQERESQDKMWESISNERGCGTNTKGEEVTSTGAAKGSGGKKPGRGF